VGSLNRRGLVYLLLYHHFRLITQQITLCSGGVGRDPGAYKAAAHIPPDFEAEDEQRGLLEDSCEVGQASQLFASFFCGK
jgi:hypothetical protein